MSSRTWIALTAIGATFAVGPAACSQGGDAPGPTSASASSASSSASSTAGTGGTASSASASTGTSASASGTGGTGGSCKNLLPNETLEPAMLSNTGLYTDTAKKALAPYVKEFTPAFPLWSDGAEKHRWVYLPECGNVDTSAMDDWQLPVGTRIWKEFSLGGKRLETRMIHRYGPGAKDYLFTAYQWDAAESDAALQLNGVVNAGGTDHDIPDVDQCKHCHGPYPAKGGMPSRYLGFSALQLSHAGPGVTLSSLIADGKLSKPPAGDFTPPGTAVEKAALGYLHANCGNCHNDTNDGILVPAFNARLSVSDADVTKTGAYATMVNQKTTLFLGFGCNYRIAGQSVADSCAHLRMSQRGTDAMPNTKQMPPFASEVVDMTGLMALDAWIATLPAPM